ncbi:MAG: GFA family protein [Gammaproteobacteria bacterium]
MKGSCLCGGVEFEVQDLVGPFELCHCSRCRKVSGSAYVALVGASTAGYRIVCGRDLIRTYVAPLVETPPPYTVFFCSRCGSCVPDPEPVGEWFEIPAGLLDDEPNVRPDKHIYVDRKASWDRIRSSLPEFTMEEIRNHRKRTKRGRVPARAGNEPDC